MKPIQWTCLSHTALKHNVQARGKPCWIPHCCLLPFHFSALVGTWLFWPRRQQLALVWCHPVHTHFSVQFSPLCVMNLTSLSFWWISAFAQGGKLPGNLCIFRGTHRATSFPDQSGAVTTSLCSPEKKAFFQSGGSSCGMGLFRG